VPGRASAGPVAVRHIGVPVAEFNPPGWPAWPPGVTTPDQDRPACEHTAVPSGPAVSTQRPPSTTTSPPPLSTPLKGPTNLTWSCCPRVHETRMKSTFQTPTAPATSGRRPVARHGTRGDPRWRRSGSCRPDRPRPANQSPPTCAVVPAAAWLVYCADARCRADASCCVLGGELAGSPTTMEVTTWRNERCPVPTNSTPATSISSRICEPFIELACGGSVSPAWSWWRCC
jgi:hypothetical protein